MDWNGIHRHFEALHHTSPSEQARVNAILNNIEQNVIELAKLGHIVHLADGKGPEDSWEEWPRLMYHLTLAPNGRRVESEEEASDLGPGWFYTFEDVQKAGAIPLAPAQVEYERKRNERLADELRLGKPQVDNLDPLAPKVPPQGGLQPSNAKQSPPITDKPLGEAGASGNDEGKGREAKSPTPPSAPAKK